MNLLRKLYRKHRLLLYGAAVVLTAALAFGIVTLILYFQPISKAFALDIAEDSFTLHIDDEADIQWSFPEVTEKRYFKSLQRGKQKKLLFESTDENVVTVDENGHIKATGKGSAEIRLSVSDLTGTVHVDSHVRGTALSFEEKSYVLNVGEYVDLPVTVSPSDAVLFDKPTYSSEDEEIVKFVSEGRLFARGPGICHVFAEADGIRSIATVRVYQPMRKILLSGIERGQTVHMERGFSQAFPVRFYPENTTDPRDLTYTLSDPSMGTIDENGVLTAEGRGPVTLTVSCNGFSDSVDIEMHVTLSDIQLNHEELTFNYQEQDQLTFETVPADTTDQLNVSIWSENPEIVSVDGNGLVTAAYPGTAAVVVNVNGFEKRCVYTVLAPVTAINLSTTGMVLNPGNTATLGASVVPDFTTEDHSIAFASENPGVATVDANGVITAVSPGRTRIIASHGNVANACSVTVRAPRDIIAERIISFGKQFLGTRYVYGGNSLTGGIDCSSFTKQCFASQGIYIARVSASQAGQGVALPMDASQWLPGDLIFYAPHGYIEHVAIYIGDGQILHAAESIGKVAISSYEYNGYVPAAARRYF